jgi:hypothetical protein
VVELELCSLQKCGKFGSKLKIVGNCGSIEDRRSLNNDNIFDCICDNDNKDKNNLNREEIPSGETSENILNHNYKEDTNNNILISRKFLIENNPNNKLNDSNAQKN